MITEYWKAQIAQKQESLSYLHNKLRGYREESPSGNPEHRLACLADRTARLQFIREQQKQRMADLQTRKQNLEIGRRGLVQQLAAAEKELLSSNPSEDQIWREQLDREYFGLEAELSALLVAKDEENF